jgi:protein ImuA
MTGNTDDDVGPRPDDEHLRGARVREVQRIDRACGREGVIARLREILPQMERRSSARMLPLGLAALDGHLPQGGLALDAVHEFAAADNADMPAAFGFMAALLGHAAASSRSEAPALLALSRRSLDAFGRPYAHGLKELGLAPERLLLLEAAADKQVLWALEEALRLRALGAVAGWLGGKLDLKASRRLQLAAEGSGALLLLLRPPQAEEPNAAATRWRIGAAPAAHDRFGCFATWRWRIALERCRNGRPGAWIVELRDRELSHGAHPFGLVGPLADPALPAGAEPEGLRRAG